MNIIISPAKKMQIEDHIMQASTMPFFLEDAKQLHKVLSSYSMEALKKLLKANDEITKLNYARFQEMDLEEAMTPAVLSYVGIQYQSMAPNVFESHQWEYIQAHLKILSGFYGMLRACDGITPYRLEMQAMLPVGKQKDLYGYWGARIYDSLIREDSMILNLASKEYSKVVEPYLKDKQQMVTCKFGELNDGAVKIKATAAKMARGDMVRWLSFHQIQDVEKVKEYGELGYSFDETRSNKWEYVFLKCQEKTLDTK